MPAAAFGVGREKGRGSYGKGVEAGLIFPSRKKRLGYYYARIKRTARMIN